MMEIKVRHGLLRLLRDTTKEGDPAWDIMERALANKGIIRFTEQHELIRTRWLTDALIQKCWREIREYSEQGLPRKIYTRSRRRRMKAEVLRDELAKLRWVGPRVVVVCTSQTPVPDVLPGPIVLVPDTDPDLSEGLSQFERGYIQRMVEHGSWMRPLMGKDRDTLSSLGARGYVTEDGGGWRVTKIGIEAYREG